MFAKLLLGHLVGDYLLQTNWMAWNKTSKTPLGVWACHLHCLLYSICVSLFVGFSFRAEPSIIFLAFLIYCTHYPIDKWSLAKYWVTDVLGREMPDFEKPLTFTGFIWGLVYVVADNTVHLLLMYAGIRMFFPELV